MSAVISALQHKAGRPRSRPAVRVAFAIGLLLVSLATVGLLVKSPTQNNPANPAPGRMADGYPVIAGVWTEWDGIVLNLSQQGNHFSADCRYGQPGVTVHWQADGTISADGKISARLVHTDPPRPQSAKPQICTAQLQPDGQTIRSHRAILDQRRQDFYLAIAGSEGG